MMSLCSKIAVRALSRRINKSACMAHASALGKDTAKAVNNPQENAMLVDACANCSVTIEFAGIA